MLDKVNVIFRNMQRLEIQPTDHNVGLLNESYGKIKELAEEILQAQELIRELERKTEAGDGKTDPEDGGPEDGDGKTDPEDGGPEAGDANG